MKSIFLFIGITVLAVNVIACPNLTGTFTSKDQKQSITFKQVRCDQIQINETFPGTRRIESFKLDGAFVPTADSGVLFGSFVFNEAQLVEHYVSKSINVNGLTVVGVGTNYYRLTKEGNLETWSTLRDETDQPFTSTKVVWAKK